MTDVEGFLQSEGEIFGTREAIYGCKPEVSVTLVETSALVDPMAKLEIKVMAHL